jgi:hypothetical protein
MKIRIRKKVHASLSFKESKSRASAFLLLMAMFAVVSIAAFGAFVSYSQLAGSATTSTHVVSTSTFTQIAIVNGKTVTQTLTEIIQPAVSVTIVTSTSTLSNTTTTITQAVTNSTTCTIWSNGTNTC